MKKLLKILIGTVALGAVPAFAGPHWQAIEQARKKETVQ